MKKSLRSGKMFSLICFLGFLASSHSLKLHAGEELDAGDYSAFDAKSAFALEVSVDDIMAADNITFPHGEVYELHDSNSNSNVHNFDYTAVEDSNAEADLTVDDSLGTISGRVGATDGRVFLVEEAPDASGHVWIEVEVDNGGEGGDDTAELPEGVDRDILTREQMEAARRLAMDRQSGIVRISIKVYYTTAFRQAVGPASVPGIINNILQLTNQGYANSGVLICVFLHCTEEYTGREESGNGAMLNAFRFYKSSIAELRGSADIAMLITQGSQFSGIAYVGATSLPIGMARASLSLSQFTFGHEVGHILGCSHNIEQTPNPFVSYGVGYLIPNTNERTIMAYPNNGHFVRINYHSSRTGTDNHGHSIGTVNADCVRLLNERKGQYVPIGDESETCGGEPTTTTTTTTTTSRPPPSGSCQWQPWVNRDHPSGTGDWEVISVYPTNGRCPTGTWPDNVANLEARRVSDQREASQTGETLRYYNTDVGFACVNSDQSDDRRCDDYEVRVCCAERTNCRWQRWVSRDRPSGTGDWEVLSVYPAIGRCPTGTWPDNVKDIEARRISDQVDASQTGETFRHFDTTVGFVCVRREQPDSTCDDYEVRVCCT